MAEAVRLVIWDLDDTYWKGTVSEGGIREYVREHHDIVIELARRGIISSICSKNDPAVVTPILQQTGIHDYFVFPSISWEPKGARLAQLIDTIQLRPQTVMFIDDNPGNRAEALAAVPGLQVADESFIAKILDHPSFVGKDDSTLTRLRQYQLMQTRASDRGQTSGDNEAFLRSCDIKLRIEYNVEAHIDRAIELINRTNQLNYTKQRLPEDKAAAREILLREVNLFDSQAGLIQVADKYGDYGMVGFFLMKSMRSTMVASAANGHLRHFCFSCRTLGMRIEQWVYGHLGRPELNVVGEVLTNLSESVNIDWVRQVESFGDDREAPEPIAPQIVISGGCEANAVAVYLGAHTPRLDVFGNYAAAGCFVRVTSGALLLNMCRMKPAAIASEAEFLGLPLDLLANDVLGSAAPGTLFVLNFGLDATDGFFYFRHRSSCLAIHIEPRAWPAGNFLELTDAELNNHLLEMSSSYTEEQCRHLRVICAHFREHYDLVSTSTEDHRLGLIRQIIECTPPDSKVVLVVDHDETRSKPDVVSPVPELTRWAGLMRELASHYPYVGVATFTEVIRTHNEIQLFGNHYHREVYWRFAQRVLDVARMLQRKSSAVDQLRTSWTVVCNSIAPSGLEVLQRGWSGPENDYTWTEGNLAVCQFAQIDPRHDYTLQIVVGGVCGPYPSPLQRLRVEANDAYLGGMICREPSRLEFFIPRNSITGRDLNVTLHLPDATRPDDFLHNDDRRLLGLAVVSLQLSPFHSANSPLTRQPDRVIPPESPEASQDHRNDQRTLA